MDIRICILSTNLTEGLQSYSERRLCFPWAVPGLAAERVLRLEEKRALCAAISDVEKSRTMNVAGRDPEDRVILRDDRSQVREKMFDKTLADSFPASDPPSSTPDPAEEDSFSVVSERNMNVDVHITSADLKEALGTYIERRLHLALGRFAGKVGRVSVRVEDVPVAGAIPDASCRIRIELLPSGQMIRHEAVHSNLYIAIDLATERIDRVFERELDRIRSVEAVRNLLAETRYSRKKRLN